MAEPRTKHDGPLKIESHYTVFQVAEMLGVTENYVRELIRTRELRPVIRLKREWRIPASVFQRFLEMHKETS